MKIRGLGVAVAMLLANVGMTQEVPKNWHLLDAEKDGFRGISLEKAYQFVKGKKSTPVIVAVIDSGIDTTHEDLRPVLWRNTKELPGNGKDDDGNGYTDDVFGWNFLGNAKGEIITKASSELARIYHRYKDQYLGKKIDTALLSPAEKENYLNWKRAEAEITPNAEDQFNVAFIDMAVSAMQKHDKLLREDMKKDVFTIDELVAYVPTTMAAKQAKTGFLTYFKFFTFESTSTNKYILDELTEYVDNKRTAFTAKDNPPADLRKVIGDNYQDINDRFYGNSNVVGGGPVHGTHVSGIIGAVRNSRGAEGVADNVRIMMLRAVPNGDEYDKDIALAIRYAVDNGAKIINMSFGKGFSPEKRWVDDAVRYAESKGVLLVHAAGNDAQNVEVKPSYPTPYFVETRTRASNYMTVGASSDPQIKGERIADFSNYGNRTVDVFAPGVKIYSTLPGTDQYGNLQGTSMAAPVVSGIAALIWSHYPQLTVQQVREAIERTVSNTDSSLVNLPGEKKQSIAFNELAVNPGVVNAYAALQYADKLSNQGQETPKKKERLPKSSFKNKKIN